MNKKILYIGLASLAVVIAHFLPLNAATIVDGGESRVLKPVKLVKPLEAPKTAQVTKLEPVAVKAAPVASASGGSCASWMAQAGIPVTTATTQLILKESGCRTGAINPSSGACGIPQALPCSKLPCPLNDSGAVCQLRWMDTYVKGRYGSWNNAYATWQSRYPHWY